MYDDTSRRSDDANGAAPPTWDALARYVASESPRDEVAHVQRWLEANPTDKALIEVLSSAEPMDAAADVDVEAALTRVHARMEQSVARPQLTLGNGSAGRTGTRARRWPAAAGLLLAAAAGIVGIMLARRAPTPSGQTALPAATTTYSTRTGQRDSIMLADGSRIILGPGSQLSVPAGFGSGARAVALIGDAYFDVRHDPRTPFTVRIANALVEDIGTTFVVESDAGDATSVSVLSGSVRLRATGSPATAGAILAAGDRGSLTMDGQVRTYPKSVRSDDAAWTTGRIVFRDAALARIIREVRRWYGVEVQVADTSLLRQHVTTTFDESDSIDQVLRSLALTLGARVERAGNTATLHSSHESEMVR